MLATVFIMKIYKFQDIVDGRFAFIVAKNQGEATKALQNLTSIGFKFIESKTPEELNRPIVLMNTILPF
jgi:hypothetical protein